MRAGDRDSQRLRIDLDTRGQRQRAVDDDHAGGIESPGHEPFFADPRSDGHRTHFGGAVLADQPHERSLRALLYGAQRHGLRVRTRRTLQAHAHELVRPQQAERVGHRHPDAESAGLCTEARIGKGDAAGFGKHAAVGEHDLDGVLAARRPRHLPALDLLAIAQHLGLREAERHPHRRQRRHRRQLAVGGADVGAVGDDRTAGDAGDRRTDRRVGQVQLGGLKIGAGRVDVRLGRQVVAVGIVEILARQRVLLRQGLDAVEVELGHVERRLRVVELGLRRVDLRLERLRVHQEKHLARPHDIALGVHAPVEEATDARLDVDRL
jgi:hypothetical protein